MEAIVLKSNNSTSISKYVVFPTYFDLMTCVISTNVASVSISSDR